MHCLLYLGKFSFQHPVLFHQLIFFLAQFEIFSAQLLFVLNQLGYFIKLERWKLTVLLQELKQIVSNLHTMMCFMVDLVPISEVVREMEVEGTVFQFETET